MRALSFRQPWAWSILEIPEDDGPKRDENRDWPNCRYRGPVLLHASKGCTRQEYADAVRSIMLMREDMRRHGELAGASRLVVPPLDEQPRGALLGIARIVGAERHPEYEIGYRGFKLAGALGLRLADVRKLPRVPYLGMLGFFNVDLRGSQHEAAYLAAWAELEEHRKQDENTAPARAGVMPAGWIP